MGDSFFQQALFLIVTIGISSLVAAERLARDRLGCALKRRKSPSLEMTNNLSQYGG